MFWGIVKNGGDDRSNIESLLLEISNSTGYVPFGKFQRHIIMRTIESCIHQPFGEVSRSHCGHGRKETIDIFIKNFGGFDGEFLDQKGRADGKVRKTRVNEMLQMISDHINIQARYALGGKAR